MLPKLTITIRRTNLAEQWTSCGPPSIRGDDFGSTDNLPQYFGMIPETQSYFVFFVRADAMAALASRREQWHGRKINYELLWASMVAIIVMALPQSLESKPAFVHFPLLGGIRSSGEYLGNISCPWTNALPTSGTTIPLSTMTQIHASKGAQEAYYKQCCRTFQEGLDRAAYLEIFYSQGTFPR